LKDEHERSAAQLAKTNEKLEADVAQGTQARKTLEAQAAQLAAAHKKLNDEAKRLKAANTALTARSADTDTTLETRTAALEAANAAVKKLKALHEADAARLAAAEAALAQLDALKKQDATERAKAESALPGLKTRHAAAMSKLCEALTVAQARFAEAESLHRQMDALMARFPGGTDVVIQALQLVSVATAASAAAGDGADVAVTRAVTPAAGAGVAAANSTALMQASDPGAAALPSRMEQRRLPMSAVSRANPPDPSPTSRREAVTPAVVTRPRTLLEELDARPRHAVESNDTSTRLEAEAEKPPHSKKARWRTLMAMILEWASSSLRGCLVIVLMSLFIVVALLVGGETAIILERSSSTPRWGGVIVLTGLFFGLTLKAWHTLTPEKISSTLCWSLLFVLAFAILGAITDNNGFLISDANKKTRDANQHCGANKH
jgi:hypothetical protein